MNSKIGAPEGFGSADDIARERSRQRALDGYHVVGSLPEAVYDDVVHVAAALCDTPIALVSLLDRDRQWFKARTGLDVSGTERDIAVCDHAIRNKDELLEIADLSRDARFVSNPLVTGDLGMRFYAGMPLVTPDGHAIGTVCVIDREPRALNEAQREAMRALARIAMALIDAGGQRRRQQQAALQDTSGLAAADPQQQGSFIAAIVELQDHAGTVARKGADSVELLLQTMEETLAQLLPAGCPGAVSRNPGSPDCTLVFEGNGDDGILLRIEEFVAAHAQATDARILMGAAASKHPGEPMPDVFLRADDALSLAKDGVRA